MVSPSPKKHPNAFGAFSSGALSALVLYELEHRLGLVLAPPEEGFIVALVAGIYLLFGGGSGSSASE